MECALELENLTLTYNGRKSRKEAVRQVSLAVARGEIFGFLGLNGAGKTTTIKAVLNLLVPDRGAVRIFNLPAADQRTHRRIGYMPETADYYWYLTPRELLTMYAGFFFLPRARMREKINSLLALVDLEKEGGVLMKYFSKGMMQKVSLAQALINDPDLLIFDEPASGLDPLARRKVRDIIHDLKSRGKTIFFSSHELSEVELVSDRVGIIHEGRLVTAEKLADILHGKGREQSLEDFFLSIIRRAGA